jgi:hypothetical protein
LFYKATLLLFIWQPRVISLADKGRRAWNTRPELQTASMFIVSISDGEHKADLLENGRKM